MQGGEEAYSLFENIGWHEHFKLNASAFTTKAFLTSIQWI